MLHGAALLRRHGRAMVIALTAMLAIAVYLLLPPGVNELARRAAAIFVVAAVFWATEVLPVYATALCVVAMQALFLADDGGIAEMLPRWSAWPAKPGGGDVSLSITTFFTPLGSPIIVLFLGGFLLAAAIVKHGLDRVIASRLLAPVVDRPLRLMITVGFVTALLSMWMSNTAAAAVMLSILTPLLSTDRSDRFSAGLVLSVAFAANLGGMTTPISTPPNAIAMGALREMGLAIGFLDWVVAAVPLAVVLVFSSSLLLYAMFRPRDGAPPLSAAALDTADLRLTRPAFGTLAVIVAAVVFWVSEPLHGLAPSVVALLAAAALTAMGILQRRDVDSIDWNVLILMWGGLALGQSLHVTGALEFLRDLPVADLPPAALASAVAVITVAVSIFMSNTATANLMIPIAIGLDPERGAELALVAAFAASFGMAMPISTPPNAIAFATGRLTAPQVVRAGTTMTLVALLLLLVGYRYAIGWLLRHV